MFQRYLSVVALAIAIPTALFRPALAGVNYEEAPIHYSTAADETAVSKLQARIDRGEATLTFEEPHGYLKSVLQALDVSVSSQVLVFSKTSLQKDRVSPKSPRAIYFNDEVHVAYVQRGILEIAAADPQLGMAFYTLDQTRSDKPTFERQSNRCLNCHGAARTRNVPGLFVRSVYPDVDGLPVVAAGSFVTTQSSPFERRWGGWYVSGTHGEQKHLGNFILPEAKKPKSIDNSAGLNATDLAGRFDTSAYLSPHSDLVALMVLEHQSEAYNLMTQGAYETRESLWKLERVAGDWKREQEVRTELHERIQNAARRLARHLLFADEVRLTAPIRGTSDFARDFSSRPARYENLPSLREFDLQSRLFRRPCSYLIQSANFAALADELRQEALRQISDVLDGKANDARVDRLPAMDRAEIKNVIRATFSDLSPRKSTAE